MNQDLEHFIIEKRPSRTGNNSKSKQSKNSQSPNRKAYNQSAAIVKQSLGSIDEVVSQLHLEYVNSANGDEIEHGNGGGEFQTTTDAMNHTATSIISTKKELMDKIDLAASIKVTQQSSTDIKQNLAANFEDMPPITSPEHHQKLQKPMQQHDQKQQTYSNKALQDQLQQTQTLASQQQLTQSTAAMKATGTITQNSQVFSYLQRQPPRHDDTMILQQLPEYRTLPVTANAANQFTSSQSRHSRHTPDEGHFIPQGGRNMRIAVELNRSSDLSGGAMPPENNHQLLMKQNSSKQRLQHRESMKKMTKTITQQSNESLKIIKTSMQPSSSNNQIQQQFGRSIQFQRGAHGAHTNVIQDFNQQAQKTVFAAANSDSPNNFQSPTLNIDPSSSFKQQQQHYADMGTSAMSPQTLHMSTPSRKDEFSTNAKDRTTFRQTTNRLKQQFSSSKKNHFGGSPVQQGSPKHHHVSPSNNHLQNQMQQMQMMINSSNNAQQAVTHHGGDIRNYKGAVQTATGPKKWPIDPQGIIIGGAVNSSTSSKAMLFDFENNSADSAHGNNQLRSLIPNHLPLRSSNHHLATQSKASLKDKSNATKKKQQQINQKKQQKQLKSKQQHQAVQDDNAYHPSIEQVLMQKRFAAGSYSSDQPDIIRVSDKLLLSQQSQLMLQQQYSQTNSVTESDEQQTRLDLLQAQILLQAQQKANKKKRNRMQMQQQHQQYYQQIVQSANDSPSNFTLMPVFDSEDHSTILSQERQSITSSKVTLHEDVGQQNHHQNNVLVMTPSKKFSGKNMNSISSNNTKDVPRLNFRQIIENEKIQQNQGPQQHGGIVYNYSPKMMKFGKINNDVTSNTIQSSQNYPNSQHFNDRPNSQNSIQQQDENLIELDGELRPKDLQAVKLTQNNLQVNTHGIGAGATRKLVNLSPITPALSQTMSPMMKFNQTSKNTLKIGSVLDDHLPPQQSMARTFLSSCDGQTNSQNNPQQQNSNLQQEEDNAANNVQTQLRQDEQKENDNRDSSAREQQNVQNVITEENTQEKKCNCVDHEENQNVNENAQKQKNIEGQQQQQQYYQTQLNFSSENGSELKGWEQQVPKTINITLQSAMGQSFLDQTMYNSNNVANQTIVSGHGGLKQTGFGQHHNTKVNQKKIGHSAIRIEHSPSMNIIYSSDPRDTKHIHKKTQQRAIEARTISLEPTASMSTTTANHFGITHATLMSTLNKNGVPLTKRYSQKSRPFMASNRLNLESLVNSGAGTPSDHMLLTSPTSAQQNNFNSTQQVFASLDASSTMPLMEKTVTGTGAGAWRNHTVMQSQEIPAVSSATIFVDQSVASAQQSGKKSPFMSITKDQERKFKLQQKRSLMQLPKLPDQVINSANSIIGEDESQTMENALFNSSNMLLTARIFQSQNSMNQTTQQTLTKVKKRLTSNIGAPVLSQPISPTNTAKRDFGSKFVNQSSSVRQKQLQKVQKDKSQARLQLHIQRFERLYNKNGQARSQKAATTIMSSTTVAAEVFKNNDRLNRNIMMHSPLPSSFVQSPTPTIQAQEKLMSNLIRQIVETGGSTQRTRRSLIAQQQMEKEHQRKLSMRQVQEPIHIPMTRQTMTNNF